MDFIVLCIILLVIFVAGAILCFRSGRKVGQLEGFADGLVAHKEVQSEREAKQRREYEAYLRTREIPRTEIVSDEDQADEEKYG